MKRIPLYRYLAHNNPKGTKAVIKHFELPKPRNAQQAMKALRMIMVRFKEQGLMEMAKHHPDRKLILAEYEMSQPTPMPQPVDEPARVVEETLSACGCSHASGSRLDTVRNPNPSNACGGTHSNCGGCSAAANGEGNGNGSAEAAPAAKETEVVPPTQVDGTKEFVNKTLPYLALGIVIIGATIAITKKG